MPILHIQFRRDTASNWASANPVLSEGEPCYETDTGKRKFGDGVTRYNDLPYSADIRFLTQNDYDNLAIKDADTLYVIVG